MLKLILIAFLVAIVAPAHAQRVTASSESERDPVAEPADEKAREHLSRGRRLFDLGRWEEAIVEFEAGALLTDIPIWQYNLGQCNRKLQRYDKAIWHFERFIARAGDAASASTHVGYANKFIEKMRAAATQPPTTTADDTTSPADQPRPKFAPVTDEDLEEAIAAPMPATERWYHDTVGWGLAGGALAVLGTGVGLYVSASGLRGDANDASNARAHDRLAEQADTRSTWGAITLAGGAVLGAVAAVRLVMAPQHSSSALARTLSVEAGPGWAGLRLHF